MDDLTVEAARELLMEDVSSEDGDEGVADAVAPNGDEREIADAATAVADAGEAITPESIRAHLYHPEVPDVDMVVRTSGEERISGFMLWRVAYAELMFLEKYFPEMNEEDLKEILKEYEKRERRYGL